MKQGPRERRGAGSSRDGEMTVKRSARFGSEGGRCGQRD